MKGKKFELHIGQVPSPPWASVSLSANTWGWATLSEALPSGSLHSHRLPRASSSPTPEPRGLLLRLAHLRRRPGQGVGLPGASLAEGEDGAGEAAGSRGAAGPRQRLGVRARQQCKDSAGVRSIPGASLTRAAPAPLGAAHRMPGTRPPACTPRPTLRRSGTLRLGPRLGGSPRGRGSGEGAGPAEGGVWAKLSGVRNERGVP